jgi:hypothetical protein
MVSKHIDYHQSAMDPLVYDFCFYYLLSVLLACGDKQGNNAIFSQSLDNSKLMIPALLEKIEKGL